MSNYAFKKGWAALPQAKAREAKEKIKKALCISSDPQFYSRLKGIPEPTISEYVAITGIFAEYGITDIWGE